MIFTNVQESGRKKNCCMLFIWTLGIYPNQKSTYNQAFAFIIHTDPSKLFWNVVVCLQS